MNTKSKDDLPPDEAAAHEFLSELRTRISTQPLPYQYGVEARALESLWELFALARTAMKNHPGCKEFAKAATEMLNVTLRPVTAKWHRAHLEGRLKARDGADEFRAELETVRKDLRKFADTLHKIAYGGESFVDEETGDAISDKKIEEYFKPVKFGIPQESLVPKDKLDDINKDEREAVKTRRGLYGITTAEGMNAVGLALSGGGIRSATFCLGVTQVLAQQKLLKQVDFLSTVSGGGYTGSFLTTRLSLPEPDRSAPPPDAAKLRAAAEGLQDSVASPHGPDTGPIRYLRQHAKYLGAADLKEQWSMVTSTVAGMVLNWTAPLFVLALLALAGVVVRCAFGEPPWPALLAIVGGINLLTLVLYAVGMRFARYSGGWLLGWSTAATLLVAFFWLLTFAYAGFFRVVDGFSWSIAGIVAVAVSVGPAIIRFIPILQKPAVRAFVLKGLLLAAGLIIPIGAVVVLFLFFALGLQEQLPDAAVWNPLHHFSGAVVLAVLVVALGFVALCLLNVNLTSPHRLYRAQLARTFVQKSEKDTRPIALDEIDPVGSAPYHLVNATVNLPSSTDTAVRERKSDFFLFSGHWCGAPSVGYGKSAEWKANHAPVDLATAMAVSGAAASSYMGLGSMPTLTALLTFLNVRLGFWIRRPRPGSNGGTPGFLCLAREMTGIAMSEKQAWINLSDGGHIENMAVYELLRRRCKFIVSVDGEADPQSTFHGHLTLVRHAQIDFGISIEPNLSDLRPDVTSKFSQRHAILCRVKYPAMGGQPESQGLLLYVKLSVTGNELEMIKRYRGLNPDFPHQTTLDQFFDEEQFEAYRQLGVHVAEGLFSRALMNGEEGPFAIEAWFKHLAKNLLEPEIA